VPRRRDNARDPSADLFADLSAQANMDRDADRISAFYLYPIGGIYFIGACREHVAAEVAPR